MVDLSDWPIDLKIAVLLIPFVVALGGLAINFYIASSKQFDVMCAALQRSQCLREELKKGGAFTLWLRSLTVCAMTGVLLCPRLSIRRGNLDPEDYREFPHYLKRRMKVAVYCLYIGMAWMVFVAYCVEFKKT